MMTDATKVAIIGGGQAGARAAQSMRDAGFAGPITLYCREHHLPYERPQLSKTLLIDPATKTPTIFDEAYYLDRNIAVQLGSTVAQIDRDAQTLHLETGQVVPWDRLLLSTGSRVLVPNIAGMPRDRLATLRDVQDSRMIEARLRQGTHLVVIGGGFIGLEVAASAVKRGCQVTVIEAADRLLPRLSCSEVSDLVLSHHEKLGVTILLGVRAEAYDGSKLILSDGGEVRADFAVAGIGIAPETGLAEAAGLEVRDGIIVDACGQTSDPRIFAAGDATRHFSPKLGRSVRLESWQNANLQAHAAACSLVGIHTEYADVPWLWSDQGALNIQIAGAPLDVDRIVVRGIAVDDGGLALFQFHQQRLVGGITLNRGREMPLIQRLLAGPALNIDPAVFSDTGIGLRRFLPVRGAA
jgi:NADPH-dependent 2,4-dienoyl-CoA reductase/sulfur reductase-like enzyme